MKTLFAAAAVLLAVSLAGCAEVAAPEPEAEGEAQDALLRVDALVGKWRFELGDARRAELFRGLEAKIDDPAALAAAKQDIEEEAKASMLEFDKNGVFHSWVFDKELIAVPYVAKPMSPTTLLLSHENGRSVTIDFVGADTIVVRDPKKGGLTYHRE